MAGYTFNFETPMASNKPESYDTNAMPSGVAYPSMGGQYMDSSYLTTGSYDTNAMQTTMADQNMGGLEQIHAYNQAASYGMNAIAPAALDNDTAFYNEVQSSFPSGSNGLNAMAPAMANTSYGASFEAAVNDTMDQGYDPNTMANLCNTFAGLPLDLQNECYATGTDPYSWGMKYGGYAIQTPVPAMQPQFVTPQQLQQPAADPMPTQQQSGYGYAEDMGNHIDPNQDQGGYAPMEDLVMSGSDHTDESVHTPVPAVAPVAAAAPTAAPNNNPFVCNVCGKIYTAQSSLTEHSMKHSGAKITCDLDPRCAGKEWATAKGFRRHKVSEHGGKRVSCSKPGCTYSCPADRELDNMKRHLRNKH